MVKSHLISSMLFGSVRIEVHQLITSQLTRYRAQIVYNRNNRVKSSSDWDDLKYAIESSQKMLMRETTV